MIDTIVVLLALSITVYLWYDELSKPSGKDYNNIFWWP